jgi:hypothetical protein
MTRAAIVSLSLCCVMLSASCSAVRRDREAKLEITTAAGVLACRAETGDACVKVRVRNVGQVTAKIGVVADGKFSFVHGAKFGFEGQRIDGQWENIVTSLDTFEAPREFLYIRPGGEAMALIRTSLEFREFMGPYSKYRALLILESGEHAYSEPLALGPLH